MVRRSAIAFFMMTIVCVAAPVGGRAHAELKTITKSMDFSACLARIRQVAAEMGQAPVNIVETDDLRMVRFLVRNGSMLVTCSRPDRKIVILHNPDFTGR